MQQLSARLAASVRRWNARRFLPEEAGVVMGEAERGAEADLDAGAGVCSVLTSVAVSTAREDSTFMGLFLAAAILSIFFCCS